MIVTYAIIAIICVAVVAVVADLLIQDKPNHKISFKETFDLLNAPIITFIYNGRKLHFLLDTGSSLSHIRPEIVKELGVKKEQIDAGGSIAANGIVSFTDKCDIPLSYKDQTYDASFMINKGIVDSLDILKSDFNLEVHGVLGCDFFNKYNYVVDFKEAVAYSRK